MQLSEAAKIFMDREGLTPWFNLTPAQEQAFASYGPIEAQRATVAARLLSRDKSALVPTLAQLRFVDELSQAMGLPPLEADALDEIRRAVCGCNVAILDQALLSPSIKAMINLVVPRMASATTKFIDVPLKAILGTLRDNFTEEGDTWRTAAAERLYNNWSRFVFDYFESEIRDQDFPGQGALYDLRLRSVAGAVTCENGYHRLTGAVAWLAAKHGDDAVLRKAKVSIVPYHKSLVERLIALRDEFGCVKVLRNSISTYLRVDRGRRVKIFEIQDGEVVLKEDWHPWSPKSWLPSKPVLIEAQWEMFPDVVLDAWAKRSWSERGTE